MFVAVDEDGEDGEEWIYEEKPVRHSWFWDCEDEVIFIEVPKGTIQRLLNYPLTWDDDCQEIIEYKDKDLKEDKMIKQNIKMRVTPEQSKKVQEICFANGIYWIVSGKGIKYTDKLFLEIEKDLSYAEDEHLFNTRPSKEVDADLFIRTNGSCEDESTLNDDDIARILKASEDQPIEYLMQKIVNLHDQLNKYRKNIQNQKEELTRLLNQKKQLNNRLDIYALCTANQKIKITNLLSQKEDLQNQLNMANRTVKELIDNLEINEIDANCFIKKYANKDYQGSEVELLLSKMIDFKDEEYFKLEVKVFKLKKQLEKHVIKIDNQKEEILSLLLQKEDLQNRLNTANKTVGISINNGIDLVKYLEEKDILIKYLENKLAKKTNEAYEKKVMSFEELYIKQADEYYKKVEDKVMGFVIKDLERKLEI